MASFGPDYRTGYALRMEIINSGLTVGDLGGSPAVATPDVNGNYVAKYGQMTVVAVTSVTSVTSVTLPAPRNGKRLGVAVFSGTPVSVTVVGGSAIAWGGPLDGFAPNPFVMSSGQIDLLGTNSCWSYITINPFDATV